MLPTYRFPSGRCRSNVDKAVKNVRAVCAIVAQEAGTEIVCPEFGVNLVRTRTEGNSSRIVMAGQPSFGERNCRG